MMTTFARVCAVTVGVVQGWGSGSTFLARRPVIQPEELLNTVIAGTDQDAAAAPDSHPGAAQLVARLKKLAETEVDLDRNGHLDRHELVDYAVGIRDAERDQYTEEEMARWDRNRDGHVAMEEIEALLGAREMTPEVAAAMKVVEVKFAGVDFDGSGSLDRDELHLFLHPELHADALQLEAQQQLSQLDINQDGGVDSRELAAAYSDDAAYDASYTAHEVAIYDHNKDGKLDVHEMEELVEGHKYVQHIVGDLITLLDTDKDGRISMSEFDTDHRVLLASEVIEDWLYASRGRDEL